MNKCKICVREEKKKTIRTKNKKYILRVCITIERFRKRSALYAYIRRYTNV